jgi:hypothetical protein
MTSRRSKKPQKAPKPFVKSRRLPVRLAGKRALELDAMSFEIVAPEIHILWADWVRIAEVSKLNRDERIYFFNHLRDEKPVRFSSKKKERLRRNIAYKLVRHKRHLQQYFQWLSPIEYGLMPKTFPERADLDTKGKDMMNGLTIERTGARRIQPPVTHMTVEQERELLLREIARAEQDLAGRLPELENAVTIAREEFRASSAIAEAARFRFRQAEQELASARLQFDVQTDRKRARLKETTLQAVRVFLVEIEEELDLLRKPDAHEVEERNAAHDGRIVEVYSNHKSISERIVRLTRTLQNWETLFLDCTTEAAAAARIRELRAALPALELEMIGTRAPGVA